MSIKDTGAKKKSCLLYLRTTESCFVLPDWWRAVRLEMSRRLKLGLSSQLREFSDTFDLNSPLQMLTDEIIFQIKQASGEFCISPLPPIGL